MRCAARELARREAGDIVLVMNWDLPPWEEVAPAGSRLGAIVITENYRLYRLLYSRLDATAPAAGCEGEPIPLPLRPAATSGPPP